MTPLPIAPTSFPGPLDYTNSALLMNDMTFRGRVKVACLKFATYIQGEPDITPAHNTRFKWAQNTIANPDQTAGAVAPSVVMDPAVQSAGDTIDDASLQSAVENAINNQM
jgi:hypothetical protein